MNHVLKYYQVYCGDCSLENKFFHEYAIESYKLAKSNHLQETKDWRVSRFMRGLRLVIHNKIGVQTLFSLVRGGIYISKQRYCLKRELAMSFLMRNWVMLD